MAEKLLIIMVNSSPECPATVSAPLQQATAAASMEYDAEIIFSGRSGELAFKQVAEGIALPNSSSKTLYHLIQEAQQAGVKFKLCTPVQEQWGDEMIPEIEDTVGAAYLVSEAMDNGTVTFTY